MAKPKQTKQPTTPRPIIAAEPVAVRVPAPWAFGHVDQAEMRVTPSIRQLANRGDLDSRQVRAAGWVRSVIEAASASGVSGIDYSAIKVDTSTKGGAPAMDAVVAGREAHVAVALRLGSIGYHVVRAVAFTGLTLAEVAASWPTATVTGGSADKATRDFIGRTFRESLLIIADEFCSAIDPAMPQTYHAGSARI